MMHTGRTASWAARRVPVTFVAYDLPHLEGQDLTARSLIERERLLDELPMVGPAWVTNGWYPRRRRCSFHVCVELGHEGMVAKRLDAPYLPGRRTRFWLKAKDGGLEARDMRRRDAYSPA